MLMNLKLEFLTKEKFWLSKQNIYVCRKYRKLKITKRGRSQTWFWPIMKFKPSLLMIRSFSIMSISSLFHHWPTSWTGIRFKWNNFIECLLSGIHWVNSCGMSMWRYVFFTLALCYMHTALITFLHINCTAQFTRSRLNDTVLFGCWGNPAWCHMHRWGRVWSHKIMKEPHGRNQHLRATWG